MGAKLQIIDRILTWDFIIIGIENQRKWCKSTKNRQKTFHSNLFAMPTCQIECKNYILPHMAQPPRSIYFSMLTILKHTHLCFFHASFIFPKTAPTFLRENAHALRKFFIHHGKIMHTLEYSLWLSEVSPTLGHTLSMVVSWTISTYCFHTLRFLIFSHFPSFCPAVAFRLVFPTMAHGCSTDVDNPAFPRATRAPSLGFCCFCFHNLHRVPKKRSRKREKTTLILIPYSPTFSPHIWDSYTKLLKVVRKPITKH